mmetsp:Transcript_53251/g.122377  ORF Transcript_53251/g.122377 Transcript_53251/m.122377 type:complete len:276 (-) Transcript_53251:327-1154(-)
MPKAWRGSGRAHYPGAVRRRKGWVEHSACQGRSHALAWAMASSVTKRAIWAHAPSTRCAMARWMTSVPICGPRCATTWLMWALPLGAATMKSPPRLRAAAAQHCWQMRALRFVAPLRRLQQSASGPSCARRTQWQCSEVIRTLMAMRRRAIPPTHHSVAHCAHCSLSGEVSNQRCQECQLGVVWEGRQGATLAREPVESPKRARWLVSAQERAVPLLSMTRPRPTSRGCGAGTEQAARSQPLLWPNQRNTPQGDTSGWTAEGGVLRHSMPSPASP